MVRIAYPTLLLLGEKRFRIGSYGCHNDDRYPNFYIPREAKLFKEDTWVCLDYFSDMDQQAFDARVAAKRLRRLSRLTWSVLKALLKCAIAADGIMIAQEVLLRESVEKLGNTSG